MATLIRNDAVVVDSFVHVGADDALPSSGGLLADLDVWTARRDELLARGGQLGVRLKSDQPPELIAEDLSKLALVALEFPVFRDGRAYSYARILRERYGFKGEVRAVGDVLMEQLHFMLRTGFDAFEIAADDALAQYRQAVRDFSIWYQPTGDGRRTAVQRRHGA